MEICVPIYDLILDKKNDKKPKLKKKNRRYVEVPDNVNTPKRVHILLEEIFQVSIQAEEHLYMVAFDNKFHVLGVFDLAHGTARSALVSPREIYIRAMLAGATYITIAHNHLSGETTPSKEDITVTRRIRDAGDLLEVTLADHLIIGDTEFQSLKTLGYI